MNRRQSARIFNSLNNKTGTRRSPIQLAPPTQRNMAVCLQIFSVYLDHVLTGNFCLRCVSTYAYATEMLKNYTVYGCCLFELHNFSTLVHLRWRGGATGKAFGLAISRSRVQILLEATLRNNLRQVVMVALCNRETIYIFILFLLLSSFFCSPNLSSRRLDVYHTSAHGVVLV